MDNKNIDYGTLNVTFSYTFKQAMVIAFVAKSLSFDSAYPILKTIGAAFTKDSLETDTANITSLVNDFLVVYQLLGKQYEYIYADINASIKTSIMTQIQGILADANNAQYPQVGYLATTLQGYNAYIDTNIEKIVNSSKDFLWS